MCHPFWERICTEQLFNVTRGENGKEKSIGLSIYSKNVYKKQIKQFKLKEAAQVQQKTYFLYSCWPTCVPSIFNFSKIFRKNIKIIYETTIIPTMAPIRWAASAPLLPPLRHLTRSIFQCNSECEIKRQRRIHLSRFADNWRRPIGFIAAGLRDSDTIGCFRVQGQRDTRKKYFWNPTRLRQQILINWPRRSSKEIKWEFLGKGS